MLETVYSMKELDFSQLMEVYFEGNQENGQLLFSDLPAGLQVLHAEQDFYTFLAQVFFKTNGASYSIWSENGIYCAALRTEPYRDGLLIAALETKPALRRQGYAKKLLQAVLSEYRNTILYSHVSKRNTASLQVHQKCGFKIISDSAVYIDGSASRNAYTLTVQP